MKPIETDIWEPLSDNSRKLKYVGQRTAEDVFRELYYRLETTGFLPDEYFLINTNYENGAEYPKDAAIFCTVDYGESEGIYLDIYLKFYDNVEKKSKTMNFATGKTLGETGNDLDKMNLIASAVTKAFHEDGVHARYICLNPEDKDAQNSVVFFNADERQIVEESLAREMIRRKFENKDYSQTERLLRKMTGSVTEFIKVSGLRPEMMDSFDRATIAVHDGNIEEFESLLPEVTQKLTNLLAVTVVRPDGIGSRMMEKILAITEKIPYSDYLQICRNVVNNNDINKALLLMERAESVADGLNESFYGEMILIALNNRYEKLAMTLADVCLVEKLECSGESLIITAIQMDGYRLFSKLADKGLDIRTYSGLYFYEAARQGKDIFINILKGLGADIDGQNFIALCNCMKSRNVEAAKLLLNYGADFNKFIDSIETPVGSTDEFLSELKTYNLGMEG